MELLIKGRKIKFDRCDLKLINSYNWHWSGRKQTHLYGFPKGGPVSARNYLARLIMRPTPGLVVDHINGDPADNRRKNLRVCTIQQNRMNEKKRDGGTSIFKGVHRRAGKRNFFASIKKDGKVIYLGSFKKEIDAAKTYDRAALELFGPFSKLNFP